jgi:hypothetical protein
MKRVSPPHGARHAAERPVVRERVRPEWLKALPPLRSGGWRLTEPVFAPLMPLDARSA